MLQKVRSGGTFIKFMLVLVLIAVAVLCAQASAVPGREYSQPTDKKSVDFTLTQVQKDFLKAVMDDLRKMGKGDVAVSLNKYIGEGRVAFVEKGEPGVEGGFLIPTDSNILIFAKEDPDRWTQLKEETVVFRDRGNSKMEKQNKDNGQVLIRSAAYTMIHEEVHMGQHNPLQTTGDEDPAYYAAIIEAQRVINEDMQKIQEILDKEERLPGDQDKLNELMQDLNINCRAYKIMINDLQQAVDESQGSLLNWLYPKVIPEYFKNATSDMDRLTQEAKDLIDRASLGKSLGKESPSAGSVGRIIGTKGAFISSGNIVGGTDHLGFANCLCKCGCSQAGWACGSGAGCGYIGSPLGDCICSGYGEGHASIPGSGECYDGCLSQYKVTAMKGNITPLLPANPLRDNGLPSDRLIQTTGETLMLLQDGSKVLAKPGSTFNFTSPEPGRVRANLLLGSLWIEHGESSSSLEVQMANKTIQPKGTEFVCQWDGAGGKVSVAEGSVSITDGASQETLQAGKEISLPQGTVEDYDLSQDQSGLVAGLPLRDLILEEGEPEPFGEYDPAFQGGQIPEDWLWQDPGSDAEWTASSSGGLVVTVPDGNEFWGYPGVTAAQRSDAPRLLHKVTGDFDLQGRVTLETNATDLATVEFIYYSPGSFIGQKSGLMKQDLLSEHYSLPGGGWLRAGGLDKLPVLGRPSQVTYSGNSAELKSAPDAPEGPVFLKFSRRGNILKTYHSLDGESWTLSSRQEVDLSQTIWIGWVFKRMAYEGLKDEPAVLTLEDVRLKTAEPGSLPVLEWDQVLQAGSTRIEESGIQLSLDGSARGLTAVVKGQPLIGDFQATVSFQAENVPPQSGESRYLALTASNSSGQNSTYVGWISDSGHVSPLYTTEFFSSGYARDGAHDYTDDWSGKLRMVRQEGNLSTYFWKNGDWSMLGNFQKGYPDPVYIGLEVCNEREAAANASMTVDFAIDEIIGDVASAPAFIGEGENSIDTSGISEENDFSEPSIGEEDVLEEDFREDQVLVEPAGEMDASGNFIQETDQETGADPSDNPEGSALFLPQRNFAFERWGAYNYEQSSGRTYFTGYVPEPTYGMEDSSLPLLWEESGDKSLMALGLASEVLIDNYQEQTITKNSSLILSDGYQLHVMSVEAQGERAYLELTRYGEVLDSCTVRPNASFSGDTYCYKTDMGSAKGMVVIAVHFKNAFAGLYDCLATCDGVFQISSSPISYSQLESGG